MPTQSKDVPVRPRGVFDPPEWTESDVLALRIFLAGPTGRKFTSMLLDGERSIPTIGPGDRIAGTIEGYRLALSAVDFLTRLPEASPDGGGTLPPLDDVPTPEEEALVDPTLKDAPTHR